MKTHRSTARRAFVLIELLLVLIVIAILAGGYFGTKGSDDSKSTYQRSMDTSRNSACLANRVSLRTQIQMFQMNNPGKPVTTENLQAAGYSVATCPDGGAYGFKDGQILCSKHQD